MVEDAVKILEETTSVVGIRVEVEINSDSVSVAK